VATGGPGGTPSSSPLTVAVQSYVDKCGKGWIVPVEPGQLVAVPGAAEDPAPWSRDLGGVPASGLSVVFTIDSPGADKVTLHALRIVVAKRTAATRGTHVSYYCGDPAAYRFVAVDLDVDPPKRSFVQNEAFSDFAPAHERRRIKFPYVVSNTDPESFEVVGNATRFTVDWWVEVTWSMQGRTGVLKVDDNGAPFRVSGSSAARSCAWLPDGKPGDGSAPDCPAAGT
jgi:hypothetical protein